MERIKIYGPMTFFSQHLHAIVLFQLSPFEHQVCLAQYDKHKHVAFRLDISIVFDIFTCQE